MIRRLLDVLLNLETAVIVATSAATAEKKEDDP